MSDLRTTLLDLFNSERDGDPTVLREAIKLLARGLVDIEATTIVGAEMDRPAVREASYRYHDRNWHRPIRPTHREAEILELLSLGFEDKEIASALRMSLGTLRTHISRLFLKLNQRRRAGLVAAYMRLRVEVNRPGLAGGSIPRED
jgi:DNA-binding NarL/FixJ family response regulator